MGGGRWDSTSYRSAATMRSSKGIADFEYSQKATQDTPIHPNLDPTRIRNKPFAKLESRDSIEHPNSKAIFVGIDVTGSNHANAIIAQKKLPNLMDLLKKYLDDPQILMAANDDYYEVGPSRAIQISDFESDNRIDEHTRNIILVGQGGGNDGESYDLLLYAAAHKTVIDCYENRGERGYLFLYADEPIFKTHDPSQVKAVFGDDPPQTRMIEDTIAAVKKMYNVFILWPTKGYRHAREQYVKLFGEQCVVDLQNPAMICEMIGSLIGFTEDKLHSAEEAANDLVATGATADEASSISKLAWNTKRKISLPGGAHA